MNIYDFENLEYRSVISSMLLTIYTDRANLFGCIIHFLVYVLFLITEKCVAGQLLQREGVTGYY